MNLPRILVFASGDKDGGGSGFQELMENSRTGVLKAEIVGVVSNWKQGGVFKRAQKLGIPFRHMPLPREAEHYQALVKEFKAEWVALSGWVKIVRGLNPATTINIHPALLPEFGGKDMYGHHVHEVVINAFREGRIKESAVCMHFVDEKLDHGPIFFCYTVFLRDDETPETLASRTNKIEHSWQSWITNLVVHGQIRLINGHVHAPSWYPFLPKE